MKRDKYLETVLDVLDEDLQTMGIDDDYEIYGSTKTNVDDEAVILLIDFPGRATRAFSFPYDENLKKPGIKSEYLSSDIRGQIQNEVLEDAARRCVEPRTTQLSGGEGAEYDEEEEYGDFDYEPF